ncbi:hypothetical protein AVEN_175551-1 [Araneus ventricosus]|uniref:Uncharacterized protein n=1 Tax=Araneus ventricosus TaxID=182803 RepID=A0A4Y2CQX1_ARAVE|nr:hypothetical protein AVEN_175551-1 [Araneus ventricosus]
MRDKYGGRIIFSTVRTRKPVFCFRDASERILNDTWSTSKSSNEKAERERIVRSAGFNNFYSMGGIKCITPSSALPPSDSNKELKSVPKTEVVGKLGILEMFSSENMKTRALQQIVVQNLNM